MSKLSVSEVFYSLQGEGVTTGIPAVFVRLGGCNLMCGGHGTQLDKQLHDGATWRCDTIEVWMKSKAKEFELILDNTCTEAIALGAHLVITGGEPLMQQDKVAEFIKWVRTHINKEVYVEIETNATIVPRENLVAEVDQWNVSPKLSNSGMSFEKRYNDKAIQVFNLSNTQYKFVISKLEDLTEVVIEFNKVNRNRIVLMPAGENLEQLEQTKQLVAELCKEYHFRMTSRMHVDIWNKKTGV